MAYVYHENHLSIAGWLLGLALVAVFIAAPIALMGLKSKNFFKRTPQVPIR
jgi:hypothetical protein